MFILNAKKAGLFFIITLLLAGCKKKSDNNIPQTPVNVYIYTTEPTFANLNAIGGWIYVNAGYKGIIVYRKSQEDFIALERACTFDPQSTCGGIIVTSDNITARDSCCGSKFLIYDGSITQGPATSPLSQYRTSYDGTTLHIFN
jgi:nitrite reductase/ring-hydroxylating ferredoxin subunit